KNWMDNLPRELDGFSFGPGGSKRGFVAAFDQSFGVNAYEIETWVVATNGAPLDLDFLTPSVVARLGGDMTPLRLYNQTSAHGYATQSTPTTSATVPATKS